MLKCYRWLLLCLVSLGSFVYLSGSDTLSKNVLVYDGTGKAKFDGSLSASTVCVVSGLRGSVVS